MKQTLYINVFGSPGSGKSTFATELFSTMKKQFNDLDIEYVPEFAKKFCYGNKIDEIFDTPENQMYIGANQFYNIYSLDKKIDVVITDSPFLLSCVYNNSKLLGENYNQVVKNIFFSHKNLNVFLRLDTKNYQTKGRNENVDQSREIQSKIMEMFFNNNVLFIETRDCNEVIKKVKEYFNKE